MKHFFLPYTSDFQTVVQIIVPDNGFDRTPRKWKAYQLLSNATLIAIFFFEKPVGTISSIP